MGRIFQQTDSGEWETFPEGTSAVILTSMHFVGLHDREWQGVTSRHELVCLEWTAPGAGSEGQDLSVWESPKVSFDPKSTLYARVRAVTGGEPQPGADLAALLGKAALITVEHRLAANGSMRARVVSASPMARGMAAPRWIGPLTYSDIADPRSQPDMEHLPALVAWMLEHRIVQAAPPPPAQPPRASTPRVSTPPPPPRRPAPAPVDVVPYLDDDIPF